MIGDMAGPSPRALLVPRAAPETLPSAMRGAMIHERDEGGIAPREARGARGEPAVDTSTRFLWGPARWRLALVLAGTCALSAVSMHATFMHSAEADEPKPTTAAPAPEPEMTPSSRVT